MAKDNKYRLSALLELRERKKDQAEHYLAECMQILRTEQERQRDMEAELERMEAKREERIREYSEQAMRGEMSAQAAISSNVYIERLKEQEDAQKEAIENQKRVVLQKKEAVEGARKDLVLASQELKAIEKHKEKWQEALKKEREAKEEQEMDEIAQSVFFRDD
tara:strand:+ start:233 stop:724 length:492 start_codon:yes stop_codon:yes gene_type:complete